MIMGEKVYHVYQSDISRNLVRFYLCGTTYPSKKYKINRPRSNIYCIEYIEEGKGVVNINDETFFPSAGDSYFLQIGKDHHYYSNSEQPWKKHFINLSGKLVDSLVEAYGLSNVSFFQGLNIENELKEILELVKDDQKDQTTDLIAILNNIFFKMYTHISDSKSDSESKIALDMKTFLNKQCTQKFNIDILCKHVSLSKSQTIRLFKKLYGTTPYQYVLDKKISLARKMLENTNLSVKEISQKLCFCSEYSFSNAFKKKTGNSPQKYKKWLTRYYKNNK